MIDKKNNQTLRHKKWLIFYHTKSFWQINFQKKTINEIKTLKDNLKILAANNEWKCPDSLLVRKTYVCVNVCIIFCHQI